MQFSLTDDQQMIRDAAQGFLASTADSSAVRAAMASPDGFDAAVWQRIAGELGWCGLAIAEDSGGLGMGPAELMLVQEQLGQCLLPSPFFATVCVGATLLESVGGPVAKELLAKIAAGDITLTAPLGFSHEARFCDGGPDSSALVILNHDLWLFAPDVWERTPTSGWDQTRRFVRVRGESARARRVGELKDSARAEALMRLYIAAEQLGGAQRCLDLTVEYVAERKQFGRTVGSFQAVKHRCAEMMVQIEATRSAVYGAAAMAASQAHVDEWVVECTMAKSLASEALFFCAGEAIQLHGGVGFTEEYDPQLYFKRAQASKHWLGSPDELNADIAGALL